MNEALSPSTSVIGLPGPYTAVVVGARGGVGAAFIQALAADPSVDKIFATSRRQDWVDQAAEHANVERCLLDLEDEPSVALLSTRAGASSSPVRLVINASGLLHNGALQPERSWRDLNPDHLGQLLGVHVTGVALLMKHLMPRFPRQGRSVFATLSARVGSIGDNQLGGWYGYRASKAAQNMLVRCAAIEAARRTPALLVLALHPGTVHSDLSEPFTGRLVKSHVVFTPKQSCDHLCSVIRSRQITDTGGFFAWDGSRIVW